MALFGLRSTALSNYDMVQRAQLLNRIPSAPVTVQPVGPVVPAMPVPTPTPTPTPAPTPRNFTPSLPTPVPTPVNPVPPVQLPAPTPSPSQPSTPATPTCPDGQSLLGPQRVRTWPDGTQFRNDSSTAICAPVNSPNTAAPVTGGTTGSTSVPTTTTNASPTQGPSGNAGVNTGSGDPTVNRLIDVMSAMYAGAGVNGGDSGFGGLVSGPIADTTGTAATSTSSGTSGVAVFVVIGVIVLIGYWYYKHHKKAA